MKRMIGAVLLAALAVGGCSTAIGHYSLVATPQPIPIEEGQFSAPLSMPDFQISWLITDRSLGFRMVNSSSETLTIVWDQVTFVDPSTRSVGVIHTGVRYLEAEKSQTPTIVPVGTFVEETLAPKDRVEWKGYWIVSPFLGDKSDQERMTGSKFLIQLAISKGTSIQRYPFVFEIGKVDRTPGAAEMLGHQLARFIDWVKKMF